MVSGRAVEKESSNGAVTDTPSLDLTTSESDEGWLARTRIQLAPVAAPSILGLFGFMIATLMVGAWQAGWYGGPGTPSMLWPLTLVAGGFLQIIAAIACFRARDGIALAVHGVWGAFWIGWSIMGILVSAGSAAATPLGSTDPAMAFWFIALTLVTFSAGLAALAANAWLVVTLGTLTAACVLSAIGFYAGSLGATQAGGWLFVASAVAAWILASALMLEGATGRTIIPLGRLTKDANIPGRMVSRPIGRPTGMPGVRVGQ